MSYCVALNCSAHLFAQEDSDFYFTVPWQELLKALT